MFDSTPLSIEEKVDQCRALALAIIEVTDLPVKELLSFIQAEKLDDLYKSINSAVIVEKDDKF